MTVLQSFFTIRNNLGSYEDIFGKLRRYLSIDRLDATGCVAHSFALVSKQASYKLQTASIYSFQLNFNIVSYLFCYRY